MRVPYLCRERQAYIKIRRLGVSINQIATVFGRSTSAIHRIIKKAEENKVIERRDNRKNASICRRRICSSNNQKLRRLLNAWVNWITEQVEKPP